MLVYLEPSSRFMWNKTQVTTIDGICLSNTFNSEKLTALNLTNASLFVRTATA